MLLGKGEFGVAWVVVLQSRTTTPLWARLQKEQTFTHSIWDSLKTSTRNIFNGAMRCKWATRGLRIAAVICVDVRPEQVWRCVETIPTRCGQELVCRGVGHRARSARLSKAHVWHCRTNSECDAEPCGVVWQRSKVVTSAFRAK